MHPPVQIACSSAPFSPLWSYRGRCLQTNQRMDWTGELLFLLALVNSVLSLLPTLTHVQSKFEYKYSFKGPYLIDSKGRIPFWTFGGSESIDTNLQLHKWLILLKLLLSYDSGSIPSEESVRVCPSIKSRKGWVWTKNAFSHPHWMIDVSVRVTGRLKHGADGMVSRAWWELCCWRPLPYHYGHCRRYGSHKMLALRVKYSATLKCGVDWVWCWTRSITMVWLVEKYECVLVC